MIPLVFSSLSIVKTNAWEDFFKTDAPAVRSQMRRAKPLIFVPTEIETTSEGQKFYVSDSFFDSIYTINPGAAILLMNFNIKTQLLIERIFVNYTYSEGSGGVLYHHQNGDCVISKVCGYDCGAVDYGMFIYAQVNDLNKNLCKDSSFSYSHYYGNASAVLLNDGFIDDSGLNISNTHLYNIGAIQIASDAPGFIKYSSITNNTSYKYGTIFASKGFSVDAFSWSFSISYWNIIHNKINEEVAEEKSTFATLRANGMVDVISCCFINNTNKYLFYQESKENEVITIQLCYIFPESYNKNDGVTVSNTKEKEFLNKIEFLKTAKCEIDADYTISGNFIQTIQLTCNKKRSISVSSLKNILHVVIVASKD